MHKFTIFTIFFSVVVVLIVADVVLNDYWGEDFASEEALEESTSSEITAEVTSEVSDVTNPEERGDEGLTEASPDVSEEAPAAIAEPEPSGIDNKITEEALTTAGFVDADLMTESYDGMIYGFWDTSSAFAEFIVLRHKVFSEANYTASLYEVQTPTDVSVFEAYQTLKEFALTSESGEINENNTYGEGSFYFNHFTKTNTVFLVFHKNGTVYAFEYTPGSHVTIRNLIDLL